MAPPSGRAAGGRRLIVNADDFGRSSAINQAVLQAHRDGILTTASLMVNGEALGEAVEIARAHPALGVGLHLTLVCGSSTLRQAEIPGLVDARRQFTEDAVAAGLRYFFNRRLRAQLDREIGAQVARFHATGLRLDHVNGHLNMHLHPVVFGILMRNAARWGISAMRLTRDPLGLNLRVARGRWGYRLSHWGIFGLLSTWAKPQMRHQNVRFTPQVFGLLQTSLVDENYLLGVLPALPEGDSELYSHPCLEKFRNEFDALISRPVRQSVAANQIDLIRYQDL